VNQSSSSSLLPTEYKCTHSKCQRIEPRLTQEGSRTQRAVTSLRNLLLSTSSTQCSPMSQRRQVPGSPCHRRLHIRAPSDSIADGVWSAWSGRGGARSRRARGRRACRVARRGGRPGAGEVRKRAVRSGSG
jgi:hypothetical protein